MKVEIRRNRSVSCQIEMTDENKKAIQSLMDGFPKLTQEQQAILDENKRMTRELEEKIWANIENTQPVLDLLGNPITRKTHEICYDMCPYTDENGNQWMAAKSVYIQPKKSEYDNGLEKE